ncbi:MAG: coiled-coil domain-containing protein [Microcystaceae cyanobacterium]
MNDSWNGNKWLIICISIANFIIVPCIIIFLTSLKKTQTIQHVIDTLKLASLLFSAVMGYYLSKSPITTLKAFLLLLTVVLFDLISFEYDKDNFVQSYYYQSFNYIIISLFITKLLFTHHNQRSTPKRMNGILRKILKLLTGNRWVVVVGGIMGGIGKVLFDLDNNLFKISRESLVCREFFKDNFRKILSLDNCSFTIWASIAVYAYLGFISAIIGYYLIVSSREQERRSNHNRVKIGRMLSYGLSLGFTTSIVLSSINDNLNLSRQIVKQEAKEEIRVENAANQITQEQTDQRLTKLYNDLVYYGGQITDLYNSKNRDQIKKTLFDIKTISLNSKKNNVIKSSLNQIKGYLVILIQNKSITPSILKVGINNIYDLSAPSNDQSVIIIGLAHIIEVIDELSKQINDLSQQINEQSQLQQLNEEQSKRLNELQKQIKKQLKFQEEIPNFLNVIASSTTKAVELSQKIEKGELYVDTFNHLDRSIPSIEKFIQKQDQNNSDVKRIQKNLTALQRQITFINNSPISDTAE